MSGEALSAANNGDIFAREATKYGANPAAKIVLFLLGISIILSPNRNLTVLPAEIVPYCVGFLDHIYPLCSAKAALSGAISARKSKSAFYQGIV